MTAIPTVYFYSNTQTKAAHCSALLSSRQLRSTVVGQRKDTPSYIIYLTFNRAPVELAAFVRNDSQILEELNKNILYIGILN